MSEQASDTDGGVKRPGPARAGAAGDAATSAPVFPDEFNLADYFLFDRLREGKGD